MLDPKKEERNLVATGLEPSGIQWHRVDAKFRSKRWPSMTLSSCVMTRNWTNVCFSRTRTQPTWKMSQDGGKQQNTAYGVFVQACWAQHKRQYPDELIHKEIEEFNKQCSVWWYNLSDQERDRFQEMADRWGADGWIDSESIFVTKLRQVLKALLEKITLDIVC